MYNFQGSALGVGRVVGVETYVLITCKMLHWEEGGGGEES